jgi:transcriptional regulator with XRE-family HTH domain
LLRTTLKAEWKPAGYPNVLKHLGDHLRRRRLDLGLQLKEVAAQLNADQDSVINWEKGRTAPAVRFVSAILTFLGYDPRLVS